MKLLALYPYLPSPTWGNRARGYYLLKSLASKYEVTVGAMVDAAEAASNPLGSPLNSLVRCVALQPRPIQRHKRLQQFANLARGRSNTVKWYTEPGFQALFEKLHAGERYDAVVYDCALAAVLRLPPEVKTIIVQHNIEYELLERGYQYEEGWLRKWYNWCEYRLVRPFELECCRRADAVLVTSERERLLLKSLLPRNVIEVVTNGVDMPTWQPPESGQEVAGRILFTGSMDYYPNVDAVLCFARVCWPRLREQLPGVEWQIVGRNPPPEVRQLAELPGVTVTGSVPDTRPYFASAMVTIVPLRIGSGTRLKILEAFAMQKAVVSTSLGAEGLAVAHGEHLLLADEPDALVNSIVELMNDPARRLALGRAGRALVEAEYSWERCGEQLLDVLERVL